MTRERIVTSTRSLMRRNGWTKTTIAAIATDAGVAEQTVYAAFGNKRALLEGLRSVMQRDSQIPELMAAAAEEPDPHKQLRLWARLVRQQMETSYDIIAIHREAARVDEEAAAAYRVVLDRRLEAFSAFIRGLRGRRRPGVDERTATDLLWAFSNEELWRELVVERSWTPDSYQEWLGQTLAEHLLPPRSPDRRRARQSRSK